MDLAQLIASIPIFGPYVPYITAAVTVASVIGTALPPPKPGSSTVYQGLYHVIATVSLAFGHAGNATAPQVSPALPGADVVTTVSKAAEAVQDVEKLVKTQ